MAITTITVTGPILDASGVAYDKAAVRFTPRGVGGDDAGDTVIVQTPVEVTPAASTGAFSISLAPSASVAYDVLLVQYLPDSEKTYRLGTITVPVSGPVALQDLLPVFDPGLPTNAELLAALSAAVASAEAAADRAEAALDFVFPSFLLRSAFVTWAGLNTVAEGTVIDAGGLAYIKRAAFTALPGLSGWDAYGSWLPEHAGAMPDDAAFDNGAALAVYWGNIAGRGTQPTAKGIYYVNTRGAMPFIANGGGFTADWTNASIDVSQTGTAGTSNSVIRMHGTAGAQIAMTYATTVASTNVATTTVTARDGSGNPVAHNLAAGDDVFLSSLDVFDIGYSALNDKRGQRAVVSTVPSTTTFTTFDAIHDALTTSPVYQKIDYFKDANIIGLSIVGSGRFDTSVGDVGINMLWCNNVHITHSNIRYIDFNGIRMDNCTHCTVDKWTGVIQETDATEEFSAHVLLLNGSQDCHITHGLSWGARHPVNYSSNSNRGIGRNCTVAYNHAYGCFYGMATHGSAVDCTFLYNNVYNSLFGVNTRSPGWSIIGMYGANVSEVVRLTLNPENIYISGTRGKKVNYLVRMAPGIDLFGTKETGNITILDSQGVEIGDNAINISPELPYFTQADAAVTAASTTTLIVIGALGGFWDANRALEGSYIDIDPDGAGGTGTVTRFISNDTWTGTVHQLTIGAISAPQTDATYTIYSGTKMGGLVIDGVNVDGCEFSPVYVKGAWTGGYIDNINAQNATAIAQPVVRVATAVGQRQVGFAIGSNIRYDNYQPPRYDDPDLTWRPHLAGIRDSGAFETRAAAVAWMTAGGKIADKEVFRAGDEWYEGETNATMISDMDDVVPYGDVSFNHWGALGNGTTDDTTAINSGFASGRALTFTKGQTYRATTTLTIPNDTKISGELKIIWAGATDEEIFIIGNDVDADSINIQSLAATPDDAVVIGTGFKCRSFVATCDVQSNTEFCSIKNEGMEIGTYKTVNFTRSLVFDNDGGGSEMIGGRIDFVDIDVFIRALAVRYAYGWSIGSFRATTKASGASQSPGHNGILFEGASDWTIDYAYISGAGEHGMRSGGCRFGGENSRNTIGTYDVGDCGGCPFKANQDTDEMAHDWNIGSINVLADAILDTGRNTEVLRLTQTRNWTIGSINHLKPTGSTRGHKSIVSLNNVVGLYIGTINASGVQSEAIRLIGDQDGEADQGPVDQVFIGTLNLNGCTTVLDINMGVYPAGHALLGTDRIGTVSIGGGTFEGYSDLITLSSIGGGFITDTCIMFSGLYLGTLSVSNITTNTPIYLDVTNRNGETFQGLPINSLRGAHMVTGPAFDPGNIDSNAAGVHYLSTLASNDANNAFGAAISWTRPGSMGRRGAALVPMQDGSSNNDVKMRLYLGSTSAGTHALQSKIDFRDSGNIDLLRAGAGLLLISPDGSVTKVMRLSNAGAIELVDP